MFCKVTHCVGHVTANTRPHQLRWGDWETGTAISCTKCSQVVLTYFLMMSLASLDTSVKLTSGNLKRVYTPGGRGRNVH